MIYTGKVVKIVDFGAFVNFLGSRDGLVHISELAPRRVGKVTDVVKVGDQVKVKVLGFDDRGKVKLVDEGGRPGDRRGHLAASPRGAACAGGRRVRHRTGNENGGHRAAVFACRLGSHETDDSFPHGPDRAAGASLLPLRPSLCRRAGRHAAADRRAVLSDGFPGRHGQRPRPGARPGGAGDGDGAASARAACSTSTAGRSTARWSRSGSAMRRASTIIRASPAASGAIQAFQGYGRMLVDADGRYSFRTLKPVAYPGRAPHIHFKVATADGRPADQPVLHRRRAAATSVTASSAPPSAIRASASVIEMRLAAAPGLEAGALATTMDIVCRSLAAGPEPFTARRCSLGTRAAVVAACRWRGSRHRR